MKDLLAEYKELSEASDPRIGKFFKYSYGGSDHIMYPLAKTAKGYKALYSDGSRERQRNKVTIAYMHSMDFFDRGVQKYKPFDDDSNRQVKNIKADPRFPG